MSNKNLKLPPQDIESEVSVLGALMIDKHASARVADTLRPVDFYNPAHHKIYEAIIDLFEKGKPVDLLTVSTRLKEKKHLKEIGGAGYLTDLINSVPTSAHVEHYANTVREQKVRRDLISASSEIHEQALGHEDFETLLDNVEKRIFNISQRSRTQRFTHLKDELPIAYERLEKIHQGGKENKLRGIATGFEELDHKYLSGLQKADLVILGARPSFGKTAMALDIARRAALAGKSVGVFSLEMSKEQVVDRIMAAQAQVRLWDLRTGKIQDEDFVLIQKALSELSDTRLFIEDTASPNILHIRSMARKLQLEHGLDLLIVDYLQLIMPRINSDSMVQQVTEISRGLKSLARELNIPVLAVSQLSRAVDQREVKIPRLSDLRESGSIEQDADVVLFLYRKDREKMDIPEEEKNLVEVIIAKHRNGPTGSVQLRFDPEMVTFRNIDRIHSEINE